MRNKEKKIEIMFFTAFLGYSEWMNNELLSFQCYWMSGIWNKLLVFKNGFVDGYQWISCVGDWVAILTYGLSCMVLVVT